MRLLQEAVEAEQRVVPHFFRSRFDRGYYDFGVAHDASSVRIGLPRSAVILRVYRLPVEFSSNILAQAFPTIIAEDFEICVRLPVVQFHIASETMVVQCDVDFPRFMLRSGLYIIGITSEEELRLGMRHSI